MGYIRVLLLTFVLASIPASAQASVSEEQAVRILIGEASGEGLKGMQAVGEVLRRRDSVKGLYGLKAAHVDHEPAWVWDMARKAWAKSKTSNITKGATHFESTDFKNAYWMEDMECVSSIGKHRFYRLKVNV